MPLLQKNPLHVALVALLCISAFLHAYRLSQPQSPVFDELYFATYASDYATHIAHIDLHPPLGKLIYAGALFTAPEPSRHAAFITTMRDPVSGELFVSAGKAPFGAFPYVRLRMVSAFFGVLLALAIYGFLRMLRLPEWGALVGVACVVFDNALLLQSRFILLDTMYLVFGLAGLMYMCKEKPAPVCAGICIGLAMSVKLVAVVFIPPFIACAWLFHKEKKSRLLAAAGVAMAATWWTIIFFGGLFFPLQDRFAYLHHLGLIASDSTFLIHARFIRRSVALVAVTLFEIVLSVSSYLGHAGTAANIAASPWYFWPFMAGSIPYASAATPGQMFLLAGNPVVWFGALGALIATVAYLIIQFRRADARKTAFSRPALICIIGYVSGLLPFAFFIKRSTFLCHYFPSLLFGIGLFAWLVSASLGLEERKPLARRQQIILAILLCTVVGGFAITAPATYGALLI